MLIEGKALRLAFFETNNRIHNKWKGWYNMQENKELKYNEPWIMQRADPLYALIMDGIILQHLYQVMTVLRYAVQKPWQGLRMQKKRLYGENMKVAL